MTSSGARKWPRLIATALPLLLLIDWAALDRWQIKGRVTDTSTGQLLADAWVLGHFNGSKPLVNLPIPPHPRHRYDICMGSAITKTDRNGTFKFDVLTYNRPLAEKYAYLRVFKPGWVAARAESPLRTSILAWPISVGIPIVKGPGELTNPAGKPWSPGESKLPASEFLSSREFLETSFLISAPTCGYATFELSVVAMKHAIEIAQTYDERDRALADCRTIATEVMSMNAHRRKDRSWHSLSEPEYHWPFDCDHLNFKHAPGPGVLEVERQVEAERQARMRANH